MFILLIVACAVLIVLPIQFGLCFRAKKQYIKCLPAAVFAVTMIAFYIMAITAKTWVAFKYLFIAVAAGGFLVFCGIAWGVWFIIKLKKKKNSNCANSNN